MKILELFAGYGSQALALKRAGFDIDPDSEIVEWGITQMIAYNALNTPYNDDIVDWRDYLGKVSNDTKTPAKTITRKKRYPLNKAIAQTNNGIDVREYSIKKKFDLLTYTFPCQDISNQGERKGYAKGSNTKSSSLWEVERMLRECEHLPKYLLMENVKALVDQNKLDNFQEWIDTLSELGYKSEWQILNSRNFGVPQKRERVYMLSVLEDKGELKKFRLLKDKVDDCKLSDILMSEEDLQSSPWPINDRDAELNKFTLSPTKWGHYRLEDFSEHKSSRIVDNVEKLSRCIQTRDLYTNMFTGSKVYTDSVRFLRPLEKARLMGLQDEEFWTLYNHPALSQNEIEALFGNSIVVNVLEEIFKCL